MKCRHRGVVVALSLCLGSAGCAVDAEPVKQGTADSTEVQQPQGGAPDPQTPAEFLDHAEKAMAEEGAWAFAVNGDEVLTFQGQENTASFEATVQRSQEPEALHSKGRVTSDDGETQAEEIYVISDSAYLKEGPEGWKQRSAAAAETKNKVEDPVAALGRFKDYAKASGDGDAVTMTTADGAIRLSVGLDSQPLADVRNRGVVTRAVREFEPTAEQLRQAGVTVDEARLTVSSLKETLVLDAETYRIRSHRFRFRFLVPHGGDDIVYRQDVREVNQGVFEGKIQLPAGVA